MNRTITNLYVMAQTLISYTIKIVEIQKQKCKFQQQTRERPEGSETYVLIKKTHWQ